MSESTSRNVRDALQEVVDRELGTAVNRDYLIDALMDAVKEHVPSVEIRSRLNRPTECQVNLRGVTLFHGVDMSAVATMP